jgi:hypothetical protein
MEGKMEPRSVVRMLAVAVALQAMVLAVLLVALVRAGRQVEAALGLRADQEALSRELASREAEVLGSLRARAAEVREAWADATYQEARRETWRKHQETMGMLRSLGTGLGAYQVDYNFYPLTLPYLAPSYVAVLRDRDAWGHPVRYVLAKNRGSYVVDAPGQDGELGTGDDYRYRDGELVLLPDPRALRVEPLPLPGPEKRPGAEVAP